MVHNFEESLKRGEIAERIIDRLLLSYGYELTPVGMDTQRKGIDRWTRTPDGRHLSLEYKTDFVAHRTGNMFIETHSKNSKLGWALTSIADVLLYWVYPSDRLRDSKVHVIKMPQIRMNTDRWIREYKRVAIDNGSYKGAGIRVPIDVVMKSCGITTLVMRKEFIP